MKKIILIIGVIFIVIEISAQEHFIKSQKSLSVKVIGTSANAYTALYHSANWLDIDPISGTILFTHRQGGAWGGLSSNLYCKYSNNYGVTWDSTEFTSAPGQMFRYPNCVIFNPSGFTNTDSLFVITCGSCTNGTNWVSNYFCSQNLSGNNLSINYLPSISTDTNTMAMINLCKGADKFHIGAEVTVNNTGDNLFYIIYNGVYNPTLKKVDWTSSQINTFFRKRIFSNGIVNWDANPNLAFSNDGLRGYFYTFGADSLDDPYFTSIPVLWETTDGGFTWTKQIYHYFDKLYEIRKRIYPTIESHNNPDTSQWIYRPDFPSGSTKDEENYPGVVDVFGNLHIAVLIEGRPSSNTDSLNKKYPNHPHLLYDIIKNDTGWNAIFIDTIKSDIVDPNANGYPYGPEYPFDMDHWLRITKNTDGSMIFVLWTDTDSSIDSTNINPEIRAWGYDITNNSFTQTKSFITGEGNIVCLQVPDIVITDGTTYKIPCTFIDPFENGVNITLPVKHYFLSGVEFNESDFVPANVKNENQTEFIYKVFPNPFSNQVQISYKLPKTSELSIEIYNTVGEKIETIFQGKQNEGIYNELLNLKVVGIYFIKFLVDNEITYSKIIKIK